MGAAVTAASTATTAALRIPHLLPIQTASAADYAAVCATVADVVAAGPAIAEAAPAAQTVETFFRTVISPNFFNPFQSQKPFLLQTVYPIPYTLYP